MGCHGMQWDAVGCDGMGWDAMGCMPDHPVTGMQEFHARERVVTVEENAAILGKPHKDSGLTWEKPSPCSGWRV